MMQLRRNVIAFLAVLPVLLGGVAVQCRQNATIPVRLSGLKKVYEASEKVVFKVTNISKQKTNIYLFMAEVFLNGRWFECTEDIRIKVSTKGIYSQTLAPGKSLDLHWSTKQDMYLRSTPKTDRRYRFIFYSGSVKVVSPDFVVKKQK